MKNRKTIITLSVIVLMALTAAVQYVLASESADEDNIVRVYLKDGIRVFEGNELDSITTSMSSDGKLYIQHFWHNGSSEDYVAAEIDSIDFMTREKIVEQKSDDCIQLLAQQKYEEAFNTLNDPVLSGSDDIQVLLGYCYEYELGTDHNIEKAKEMYALAAAQGNDEAKRKLEELSADHNTQVELPEESDLNLISLILVNNGEMHNVNGDGSFNSKSDVTIVNNKDMELIYLGYRDISSDKLVLNARETAISLLLWSYPMAFAAQGDEAFCEIKKIIGEMPEVGPLSAAIERGVKEKGKLDFDYFSNELNVASQALNKAIGLDSDEVLGTAFAKPMQTKAVKESSIGPVDEKVTIKNGSYYYGVSTKLDEAVYDPYAKTWHCSFTLYNENPIYLSILPGVLNPQTGLAHPAIDDPLKTLLKPQNSSYLFNMMGVNGFTKFIEAQGKYWKDTASMFKRATNEGWSGFSESLREGYWNATNTKFKMDVSSENDVILVTSTDMDNQISAQLLAYSVVDIVFLPIFKQVVDMKNQSTVDAVTNALIKYLLKPGRIKKIIDSYPDISGLFDVMKDVIEDFVNDVTDKVFDQKLESLMYPTPKSVNGVTLNSDYLEMYTVKKALFDQVESMKKALKAEQNAINFVSWLSYQSTFKSYYITLNVPAQHGTAQDPDQETVQHYLNVSEYTYTIGAEGGSVALKYDSDVPCSIKAKENWVTIGSPEGTLIVSPNPNEEERTCRVIIQNEEFDLKEVVVVVQKPKEGSSSEPETSQKLTTLEPYYLHVTIPGAQTKDLLYLRIDKDKLDDNIKYFGHIISKNPIADDFDLSEDLGQNHYGGYAEIVSRELNERVEVQGYIYTYSSTGILYAIKQSNTKLYIVSYISTNDGEIIKGNQIEYTPHNPIDAPTNEPFVDLGGSVKWSSCNYGANEPIGYGEYYRNSVALQMSFGNGIRMASDDEWEELGYKTTTWFWLNDLGELFVGDNGNSIFLPYGGIIVGSELKYAGEGWYYNNSDGWWRAGTYNPNLSADYMPIRLVSGQSSNAKVAKAPSSNAIQTNSVPYKVSEMNGHPLPSGGSLKH